MLETASGGTSQDTERIPPSKGHSHAGDGVGKGGNFRTQKESHQARATHILETAWGGTSQDTERILPSVGHSPTIDGIGRDTSGHRNDPTGQGALTFWRRHREGQVRTQKQFHQARGTHTLETASGGQSQETQKESHQARGTHILETSSGVTGQHTEKVPPSKEHSHTGDGIMRDKSEHRKNPTEQGALTSWRQHREGHVRIQNESHRARGTHILETASGGTRQNTKRISPSEGHSPTGDGIGRDTSAHRNDPTDQGVLTSWRQHREGQVWTQKESNRAMGTHQLETASGGTSQDTETIPQSEGHSPTGDGIGRDMSGHRNNPTEPGTLTNWRRHREGQVSTQKNPTGRGALTYWRRHREGQVRAQKTSH